ncbi:MAG: hypothetical protein ACON4Z_04000 [Planctomycetota bacterium]
MSDPARTLGMLAVTAAGLWFAYGVAVELFVSWYSGVEPPIGAGRLLVAWISLLASLSLALAAATAI